MKYDAVAAFSSMNIVNQIMVAAIIIVTIDFFLRGSLIQLLSIVTAALIFYSIKVIAAILKSIFYKAIPKYTTKNGEHN